MSFCKTVKISSGGGKNEPKTPYFRRSFLLFCFRISCGTPFKFRMAVMASRFFYSRLFFFLFFLSLFVKRGKKERETHICTVETFSREREKGHENSIRLFLEIRSLAPCFFPYNGLSGFFLMRSFFSRIEKESTTQSSRNTFKM